MKTTDPPKTKTEQGLDIVPLGDEHRDWLKSKVQEIWKSRYVVTRGIAHQPADLPGFLAKDKHGKIVGVATYRIDESECELITLDSFEQWKGIGTILIDAVEEEARRHACGRMWMITTNDNLDGLRFYQRRGYVICDVHPGVIEESRKMDPSIPITGNYGIDIRDEIELEKNLYCWVGW